MTTYDVFLSHSSADVAAVNEIERRLRDAGMKVFFASQDLVPGEPRLPALEAAIEASTTVAVFVGPEGVAGWHDQEKQLALVHAADERGRRVIPVLLPGASPQDIEGLLSLRTGVDLSSHDGFERLVAGVRGEAPRLLERLEPGLEHARRQIECGQPRRIEYLARLLHFDRRRRPLGGLLRDDQLLPQSVTMNAVEVPVYVERDEGPEPTDDVEVGLRELAVVLDDLHGKETCPVLMIIGDVGTGKTTLLEQTTAKLARSAQRDPDAPLPFLLSAFDLVSWPDVQTNRSRLLSPESSLHRDHRGGWIYLIDGWDEVKDRDAAEHTLSTLVRDPGTRAIVVASRPVELPRLDRSVLRYRIAPWTRELETRFEARWATVDPKGRILDDLWGNPLTVTISAAISRLAEDNAPRAQLFHLLIEKIFDGWASQRQSGRSLSWTELAPAYQQLARRLLEGDQETFSRQEVHAVLMREVPHQANRALLDASNELGLLTREPNGRYRFISRPVAEHLAGAGLVDVTHECFVRTATAAWAEEPARHGIGLLAIRDPGGALALLRRMCDLQGNRQCAPFSLRLATIAAKAASDLGKFAEPVASLVCDALLEHLFDETSTWQSTRAGETVRALVEKNGFVGGVLREKAGARLDAAMDDAVDTLGVDDLYHREPIVRVGGIEALSTRRDEPEVRWTLLRMLRDCGRGGVAFQNVATAAGMVLRDCARDAHFEAEFLPALLTILSHREQVWSGAAALALHPDEADARERLEALRHFSQGHAVPSPIVRELEAIDEIAHLLEEQPLRETGRDPIVPHEKAILEAKRKRSTPSSFVQMNIKRALGTSLIRLDESRLEACIERACQGGRYDLELLCHLAPDDPSPLVRALERASKESQSIPISPGRTSVWFSPECAEPLRIALVGSELLRSALIGLWRSRGEVPSFLGYPGAALESLIRRGDEQAAEIYAEWFPTTLNGGPIAPHLVPTDLLQVPSIRAAAIALVQRTARNSFEGYDDGGRRMYNRIYGTVDVMQSLRSLWAADPDVRAAIDKGIDGDDPGRALFAIKVLGRGYLTRNAFHALSNLISEAASADDVEGVDHLIHALMLGASTSVPKQHMGHLRDLVQSEHPARFAAGFALASALDKGEARELSIELAGQWPNLNWSFYYSRHEELLPALVRLAPSVWANRCKELGVGSGLDVARLILDRIDRAEREGFLAHLVRHGARWELPWLSLVSRRQDERLFDAVLEVVFESGVGLETYGGWIGYGPPED